MRITVKSTPSAFSRRDPESLRRYWVGVDLTVLWVEFDADIGELYYLVDGSAALDALARCGDADAYRAFVWYSEHQPWMRSTTLEFPEKCCKELQPT
jgi:hypothetical protein